MEFGFFFKLSTKYFKNYRFDENLNNKLDILRTEMKKNYNNNHILETVKHYLDYENYSEKNIEEIKTLNFGFRTEVKWKNEEDLLFDSTKPRGQFRKPAKTDIPTNFEFIKFEDGINSTIEWFINNYENLRK